jgi:methyl-accepting chemotaxis protein
LSRGSESGLGGVVTQVVNKTVVEPDSVVQQNASNAEESASAAEQINAPAEQMQCHV